MELEKTRKEVWTEFGTRRAYQFLKQHLIKAWTFQGSSRSPHKEAEVLLLQKIALFYGGDKGAVRNVNS